MMVLWWLLSKTIRSHRKSIHLLNWALVSCIILSQVQAAILFSSWTIPSGKILRVLLLDVSNCYCCFTCPCLVLCLFALACMYVHISTDTHSLKMITLASITITSETLGCHSYSHHALPTLTTGFVYYLGCWSYLMATLYKVVEYTENGFGHTVDTLL